MTVLFLSVFYGLSLIYGGYILGFLIDSNDIPNVIKVLITILTPIIAPLMSGIMIGIMLCRKLENEKGE